MLGLPDWLWGGAAGVVVTLVALLTTRRRGSQSGAVEAIREHIEEATSARVESAEGHHTEREGHINRAAVKVAEADAQGVADALNSLFPADGGDGGR